MVGRRLGGPRAAGRRRRPDARELVETLRGAGWDGWLDVEIFSTPEGFWGLPADEAARRAYAAGRRAPLAAQSTLSYARRGMRGDLPRGTVTFLFTDIEGSTRLLHALGPEAYAEALAEHRRALRAAFAAHGGVEVDTQGDAFFVAFPTADGAAAAALAANEALSERPDPRPHGPAHRYADARPTRATSASTSTAAHASARWLTAARSWSRRRPRRCSTAGRSATSDCTGSRTSTAPRGSSSSARGEFPVLRTPGSVDLPTPGDRLHRPGARAAGWQSRSSSSAIRACSPIVGPGGTGKTRFAIELARLLAEEAEGGTLFVPLAPLRDPALVLADARRGARGRDG